MTAMAHLKFLLLLLWVGFTVCTEVDLHKRIFHDHRCEKNDRLYHVKITATKGRRVARCGGSLIHREWVLTAAHCWEDEPGWTMSAYVGIHPGPGTMARIIDHKIFQDQRGKHHDIMLLKIHPPKNKIKPVVLPKCTRRKKLDVIQIAGLGRYTVDVNYNKLPGEPPHLQCAKMHVVPCEPNLTPCKSTFLWPDGNTMCYKEPRVDTCPGDSGGGVIAKNNKIHGVHVGGEDCACTGPAIALKVCSYIKWINQVITRSNGK